MKIYSYLYTSHFVLIQFIIRLNVSYRGTMAMRQPLEGDSSQETPSYHWEDYSEGNLKRHLLYPMQTTSSLHHERRILAHSDMKRRLAKAMKERYMHFRKSLDEKEKPIKLPELTEAFSLNIPPTSKAHFSRPMHTPTTSLHPENINLPTNLISSITIAKRLRSAEEALSPFRSAGLSPEAQPFHRISHTFLTSGVNPTSESKAPLTLETMETGRKVLEDRLGPSAAPTFDPSIVVDFFKLLQLTRQSQRSSAILPPIERVPKVSLDHRGHPQVFINPKSSGHVKVIRRKLSETASEYQHLPTDESVSVNSTSNKPKLLLVPTNTTPNITSSEQDLSLYIFTESSKKGNEGEPTKISEFGPYSEGNDPSAGIPPSNVNIPDVELSQLKLPEGVRDSLRKYLSPLISALKPLRKSVPGLPGLDYPILSVVPYTNFYCNNMPWPGFYADTEARCQTWHACDIDGRQSTFLCPNGTIFNQALMVCDWWYNTDCLTAPLLYPLNERLFGAQKPEPVTPHTRITPELLDTIFV